ncbi:MAG: thermonuclease family protein [Tunicatimonas sp.]
MNICILFSPFLWLLILFQIIGTASVIDGDTIEIRGSRIRLHGIDAPESSQWCTDASGTTVRCGQQAALALDSLLNGRTCRCEVVDTDRYGRAVATCYVGEININAWLVRQGWALAYREYSTDYVADEQQAQAQGRGIWQYDFEEPWAYRTSRRRAVMPDRDRSSSKVIAASKANNTRYKQSHPTRETTTSQRSGPCTIKGNINSDGERIYHTSTSRWYERTLIDESKGERWFCSEEAARSAGWRSAE